MRLELTKPRTRKRGKRKSSKITLDSPISVERGDLHLIDSIQMRLGRYLNQTSDYAQDAFGWLHPDWELVTRNDDEFSKDNPSSVADLLYISALTWQEFFGEMRDFSRVEYDQVKITAMSVAYGTACIHLLNPSLLRDCKIEPDVPFPGPVLTEGLFSTGVFNSTIMSFGIHVCRNKPVHDMINRAFGIRPKEISADEWNNPVQMAYSGFVDIRMSWHSG